MFIVSTPKMHGIVNVIILDPSNFYIHDLFQKLVANPPIVYIELINMN
jgi:hypothetical protein